MVAARRNLLACGSLAVAGAVVLRRQPGAPAPAPAAADAAPAGICGCQAAPACTCQDTLAYAQCVQLECNKGCMDAGCSAAAFFTECGKAHDRCESELTFSCGMDEATCIGNFHQAVNGVAGLKLKTETMTTNAYCGPHSKCLGEVKVVAEVVNAPNGTVLECVMPKTPSAHPPPGSRESCLKGAVCEGVAHSAVVASTNYCCPGGSVAPHVVFGDPSTCSCAMTYQEAWLNCSATVAGPEATCSMPISSVALGLEDQLKGSCWLATTPGGDRLTQHAHFVIENVH
eukprot:TRINITY_DN19046_c0_g1_i1.p1 TRINITY_DN19046_c0_g1~~TRINITY_DN19046_c0_g1_i1.p1  ORF type:complete len:319 (-),score=69.12 TRINITY_DN19046_c0_g1_i1:156-1013(-)